MLLHPATVNALQVALLHVETKRLLFCYNFLQHGVKSQIKHLLVLFVYKGVKTVSACSTAFYHLLFKIFIGIAILITPTLILPANLVDSPRGVAGEIYCRGLCSQFMLFLFGVVSVYTATFLSTERWLAVQHPFKYRIAISSSKVKVCVLFIWLLGLLANAPNLTEMSPRNDFRTPCQWKYKNYQTREIVASLEIVLKFILPSLILVLVLLSLYRKFYHQNLDSSTRPHRERQLLRMCAATSFVVLICWSPNQVYYLLHKFDVVKIGTNWHHMTVALALSTSAINPIIYYVTSTAYRRCLLTFLFKVFSKCKPREHLTTTYPLADIENINTSRDSQTNRQQLFNNASHVHMPA